MQMAKQAEQRRMMGALLSRSFTIQQPELSATESIALECLKQIASEGRVADQYEIAAAIGSKNVNGGTMAGIVNRLIYPTDCPHCEAKRGKPCVDGGKPAERHLGRHLGWVEHVGGVPLQRGLWVRINSTGHETAEPQCTRPHYRYRKEKVPAPAIHQIRERSKSLASKIEATAKVLSKPLHELLMDCTYVGFHQIEAEIAEMEANDAPEDQVGETQ